jgi:hypothetical protein
MTIIDNIQLDNIAYKPNDIKNAIKNNKPIEEKLHMIICVSNAIQYESRYILAKKFIKRIEKEEKNVILYIVELAYDLPNKLPQTYYITKKNNPRHLQLRTNTAPLWHKENLLNIGINKLLKKDWKAVCWCDADIIFNDPNWAINTLKILNGTRDIVQNFHLCIDMDAEENAMSIFNSFGYQYTHNKPYQKGGNPNTQWHPGYCWSMTRKAYEQMKGKNIYSGIFEFGICGAGDNHMSLSWINNGIKSVHENVSDGYKQSILEYQERCQGLTIGYIPGVISHEFHGKKSDRKYNERWLILVKNEYNPYKHITYNKDGLLIPTKNCPEKLLDEIYNYFCSRNEDLGLEKLKILSLNST